MTGWGRDNWIISKGSKDEEEEKKNIYMEREREKTLYEISITVRK